MSAQYGKLTPTNMITAYRKAGYTLFDKGDYNVNIFGIRTHDDTANTFNDLLGILYKDKGKWNLFIAAATTDPGTYYRKNPMNVEGTAMLQPGQHKKAYAIGKHRSQYTALVQRARLPLWRDADGDGVLDMKGATHNDLAGINIHRATGNAGQRSTQVDRWSAGCQVIGGYDDFQEFMRICLESSKRYEGNMTYTLFTEDQVLV